MRSARVYVRANNDIAAIQRLLFQRVPVHLHKNPPEPGRTGWYFDNAQYLENFGFAESGYTTLFNQKPDKLPPNIAIYTQGLLLVNDPTSKTAEWKSFHLLNVIPYALDHKDEPDYKYFHAKGIDRTHELRAGVESMFQRIWKCAADLGTTRVYLCPFGWEDDRDQIGNFFTSLWLPAFEKTLAQDGNVQEIGLNFNAKLIPAHLEQFETAVQNGGKKRYAELDSTNDLIGTIRDTIMKNSEKKTLFVGVMNPHTLPGNAHGKDDDRSFEGLMGKHVTMIAQSWSGSNPYIANPDRFVVV